MAGKYLSRNEIYEAIGTPIREWLDIHVPGTPQDAAYFGDALFRVIDRALDATDVARHQSDAHDGIDIKRIVA